MPFEELPHTADWSLRVWAEDLPQLFAEAARGMNGLAGVKLAGHPKTIRKLLLQSPDPESLLVSFLSELLFIGEQEKLAFGTFKIQIKENLLEADMTGAPIISIDKIIKAVTYHNLQIRKREDRVEVEIVFDV
jgi:SHS2 domain-containing protein